MAVTHYGEYDPQQPTANATACGRAYTRPSDTLDPTAVTCRSCQTWLTTQNAAVAQRRAAVAAANPEVNCPLCWDDFLLDHKTDHAHYAAPVQPREIDGGDVDSHGQPVSLDDFDATAFIRDWSKEGERPVRYTGADLCPDCGHPGYDGHDMRSIPSTCLTPDCRCGQEEEDEGGRLLTFDEAEAAGFDATGRDGDPRFPYTKADAATAQAIRHGHPEWSHLYAYGPCTRID